jgi:uncharacterized protein (DUF2147 family)
MQRLGYLVALMALSSSAQAAEHLSFVVGGHRISIDASSSCRSVSCVSVSIPGIYQTRRKRERDDDRAVAPQPAPAKPAVSAPVPAQAAPVVAPGKPVIAAAASVPPAPQPPTLAATTTQLVAPPQPRPEPVTTASIATAPIETPPAATLTAAKPSVETTPLENSPAEPSPVAAKPAIEAIPPLEKVSQQIDATPADTPLGDWQTEGKTGTVRVEPCGRALCGYILDPGQDHKGDTILINMTSTSGTMWSGNIYSRVSGNTYHATMTMKGANTLRVEACALGRFFCSGNDWTRLATPAEKLLTSRQVTIEPRS